MTLLDHPTRNTRASGRPDPDGGHAPGSQAPTPPESLSDRAAGNLDFIRETIRQTRTVSSLSGTGLIMMGVIGCLASGMTLTLWSDPADAFSLTLWQVAALAAAATGALSIAIRVRRRAEAFWTQAGQRFVLCLAPSLAVGALLTAALSGGPNAGLLPGIWMLSYGAGVLAASTYASMLLTLMGGLFLLLGAAALLMPVLAAPGLLVGFGFAHVAFGLLLLRADASR